MTLSLYTAYYTKAVIKHSILFQERIFMLSEIFLALTVCLDIYLAAAAYSNSDIKIPPISAVVISGIGAAVLGASLAFSGFLGNILPISALKTAGLITLTVIGMTAVFKSFMRRLVRRLSDGSELSLKMNAMGIVVKLYLDDTAADIDKSKTLSVGEAAMLAAASSIDSAATGLNCGFSEIDPIAASLLAFAAGTAAILLGGLTGKKISSLNHDFSWIGGLLLISFAIFVYIS